VLTAKASKLKSSKSDKPAIKICPSLTTIRRSEKTEQTFGNNKDLTMELGDLIISITFHQDR
jgi:hypothetical protein